MCSRKTTLLARRVIPIYRDGVVEKQHRIRINHDVREKPTNPPDGTPLGQEKTLDFEAVKEREHNLPHLKTYRRALRNNSTSAEAALWTALKGRQLEGRKFRRQHSVGNYILDFYCPSEKLAIELDGASHEDPFQADYDWERDAYLNARGIRVIRIENKRVFEAPDDVLDYISSFFMQR